MKVCELFAALEERIPRGLSCSWDNDGLMVCPDGEREVRRVLVALDVTEEIVKQAIAGGYDVILSHHPMIFRPLKAVNPYDAVARKAIRLLCAGVSVMSFHTRLDAVSGGVNDTLAALLGLENTEPFGNDGEEIGRIGTLPKPMQLSAFAKAVRDTIGAPAVQVSDAGRPVSRVAVLGGSGSDDVSAAIRAGADTYVSGELGHHYLTDAPDMGINLIAGGHFHTENPVCEVLSSMALEIDPSLTVDIAFSNPVQTV
jgi:dinuclear metal center YbgI/SA1388 family protein